LNSTPIPGGRGTRTGLSPIESAVLGLFFLSGASALVYEVVWTREFTTVFGGSAFAIATVLAAYMAGLALGSTVFGRSIDRRGHPLVIYGLLEAAVGVWALLLPAILRILDGVYGGLYRSLEPGPYVLSLVRFVLSFLVLLVPTTMMGGTLPVLGKLLFRNWKGLGTRAGLLYGSNTLGAVLGTMVGGFVLLPGIGLNGSTYLAAVFNGVVAVSAITLARAFPFRSASPPAEATAPAAPAPPVPSAANTRGVRRAVLWVYAASGFAALGYEVAWTKTLSMVLGTTNYAFTSMLATFLLGLSLGSLLFAKLADRYGRPESLLGLVQTGIPLFALLTIPIMGHMPQWFVDAFPRLGGSWFKIEAYRVLLAGSAMFIPTVLMGGTFPLVTRAYVERDKTGKTLGALYAANTLGAIGGSFLTGFVLVPWLGRQDSILAASLVNVAAAVLLFVVLGRRRVPRMVRWSLVPVTAGLVIAAVLGLQRWNPVVMASGAYLYAGEMAKYPSIQDSFADADILLYDEATEATVSVWQTEQVTSLRTNGKVEASTHGDMVTQKLISHLPVFYHGGEVQDGLMIGLASGISVGSLLTHPFKKVETVELIPSMVDVVPWFEHYNHRCLDDPRHKLIINDGRNYLLLTREKYDVIVSEPSNPWIAGVSALFTRQFFELTKKHLKPGGVFCQWVQTYQYTDADLKTALGTFIDAYPYVHLWRGAPGDLILVGSLQPLRFRLDRAEASLDGPVGDDLRQLQILPLAQLLAYYVTDRDGIARWVGDWPKRVTDDNLYLEYAVPRHMYDLSGQATMMVLQDQQRPVTSILDPVPTDSAFVASIDRFRRARLMSLRARFTGRIPPGTRNLDEALALALEIEPREILSRTLLSHDINEVGIKKLVGGEPGPAETYFLRAAAIGDDLEKGLALCNLGSIKFQAGDLDSAGVYWERARSTGPVYPTLSYNLALLAGRRKDYDTAAARYKEVVHWSPGNASAWCGLAYNLARQGRDLDQALVAARRAVDLEPTANNLDTEGFVLVKLKRWEEAESTLTRALEKNPDQLESLLHLGMAQAGRGAAGEARTAFQGVLDRSKDPDLVRRAREALQKL
jgi:spermidine synthase